MQKTFYIFCTLLHTLSLPADNGSITTGAALFGASIALVVGSQKFKKNQSIDEAQKLAQKAMEQNPSDLPKNHTQLSLPKQRHTKKKETSLLIKFHEKWHEENDQKNQAINYLFYGKTPSILPRTVFQKIKKETWEKSPEPLLLTYTPQWHEEQKNIHEQKAIKKQQIQAIKTINKAYQQNNREEIFKISDSLINTKRYSQTEKSTNDTTSTKHTFTPRNSTPQKIIILKTVHGTWSNPGSYGENQDKPLSQSFLAYAQQLALQQNATVYFDVIKWNGKLDKNSRQNAGIALGEELATDLKQKKKDHPGMEIFIQAIGHSHGCNVINFAAENLNTQNIRIDEAIFFGSPISDVTTDNIDKILNVFGKLDFTGSMGSWLSSSGKSSEIRKEGDNIKNVTLQFDGQDLNHISIKFIAMAYLPLIQKYLNENFQEEKDLIVDVYNQKSSREETKQPYVDDSDFSDVAEAESAIPYYTISGFINELDSENGFEENPNFNKSEQNRKKYIKRYENNGIYENHNLLKRLICEGESAGIPSWILTTLKETEKTSTTTMNCLDSLNNWFYNFASKKAPVENSEFDIHAIITKAKKEIEKEQKFKEKSLLIAQVYSKVMLQACDNGEDIELIQKTLNENFESVNTEIGYWQYKYEWIIGKTRTTENQNWTPEEKKFLNQAKVIYTRLSSNQGDNLQNTLADYEMLDNDTKQALASAIEQGLKNPKIAQMINNSINNDLDFMFL